MCRYFYRIWDKFRYKYDDKLEIIAAAIDTYKGNSGKDQKYLFLIQYEDLKGKYEKTRKIFEVNLI